MAEWLGCRTCDQKIAGSIPDPGSQTALLSKGSVAMGVLYVQHLGSRLLTGVNPLIERAL